MAAVPHCRFLACVAVAAATAVAGLSPRLGAAAPRRVAHGPGVREALPPTSPVRPDPPGALPTPEALAPLAAPATAPPWTADLPAPPERSTAPRAKPPVQRSVPPRRVAPRALARAPEPALPPVHADCGHRMPIHEHVVLAGESLGLIAGRYGVRRSDLIRINATLSDPNLIRPGDRIRVCPEIPPRERVELHHVVEPGETLGSIAERYQLSIRELAELQGGRLPDPHALRVGHRLFVRTDGEILLAFRPRPEPTLALGDGIRLPKGRDYHIRHPVLAYGAAKTIQMIQDAVGRYRKSVERAPKVTIGDISRRGGGAIPPHVSHRTGHDVDVGYVIKGRGGEERRFVHASRRNLDVRRTWSLIRSFLASDQVVYVFVDYRLQRPLYEHARATGMDEATLDELFQYPRGSGRSHGIIRHWPGHDDHFHVRFRP